MVKTNFFNISFKELELIQKNNLVIKDSDGN